MSTYNNQTPMRRSTRISEARSVKSAGHSVVQSVASTNVTQSKRATRVKNALPKVKVTQSHAYGAQGRLANAAELNVPVTGFAQAFEKQRIDAIARDEDISARASRAGSVAVSSIAPRSMRGSSALPPSEASLASDELIDQLSGTPVMSRLSTPSHDDTSKSFGPNHEAGMLSNGVRPRRAPAVQQVAQPIVQDVLIQEPEPSFLEWLAGTLKHQSRVVSNFVVNNFVTFFKYFGIFFVAYCIIVMVTSPSARSDGLGSSSGAHGTSFGSFGAAISHRVSHTLDSVIHWVNPPYDENAAPRVSPAHSYDTSGRFDARMNDMEAAINRRLLELLPLKTAVQRGKDGKVHISDEFWSALLSKIKSEGLDVPSYESANADWLRFLEKNEAKVAEVARRGFDPSTKLLNPPGFLDEVSRHYAKLSTQVDLKIAEATRKLSGELKQSSQSVAKSAFMDQVRLESLAYSNLVVNADTAMKKVNFFSRGLGARIDPFKTSSTFAPPTSLRNSLSSLVFGGSRRNPPATILRKWDEPEDSWCAAPSDQNGLAQVAIDLGTPMYPKAVTVEHYPKEGLLDFRAAPKEMELWVVPEVEGAIQNAPGCGSGPEGYVCLGAFSYNVHGANHVQTFNLDVDLEAAGLAGTTKTMVRVVENWGRAFTCMYRLRLHGDIAK